MEEIGHAECENGDFKIVLNPQFKAGLKGLEGFSHLQLIWWFSGCDNAADRSILTIDKPYTKGPRISWDLCNPFTRKAQPDCVLGMRDEVD